MVLPRPSLRAPLVVGAILLLAGSSVAQPKPKPGPSPAPTAPTAAPASEHSDLSDQAELARVITLYDAAKYADCVREFDLLIGREPRKIRDPETLERSRIYYAACLIATQQDARADEQMRAAIRANPTMREPDSLVFPRPVVDRFIRVKDAMEDEIKKAQAEALARERAAADAAAKRAAAEKRRVERLEALARRETVVTENSRWLATIPFGVGQFQNREPALGWIFLGTEVVLAGTALGALIVESALNAKADDDPPPDPNDLNAQLDSAHQVLVISSWSFVAIATLGIVQAQIAYKQEFCESRTRELPPDLRRPKEAASGLELRPTAVPVQRGFGLGLRGQF